MTSTNGTMEGTPFEVSTSSVIIFNSTESDGSSNDVNRTNIDSDNTMDYGPMTTSMEASPAGGGSVPAMYASSGLKLVGTMPALALVLMSVIASINVQW